LKVRIRPSPKNPGAHRARKPPKSPPLHHPDLSAWAPDARRGRKGGTGSAPQRSWRLPRPCSSPGARATRATSGRWVPRTHRRFRTTMSHQPATQRPAWGSGAEAASQSGTSIPRRVPSRHLCEGAATRCPGPRPLRPSAPAPSPPLGAHARLLRSTGGGATQDSQGHRS
jgi:hypothetical protein